jgi:uncharacterized protein (DUF433 family)
MNMTRISVNSNIHFGKPCVSGTRITVQSVLELLDAGLSFESIIQDYYPDLQVTRIDRYADLIALRNSLAAFNREVSAIKTQRVSKSISNEVSSGISLRVMRSYLPSRRR